MPVFECDPAVELNGTTTSAFLSSILHSQFEDILAKHNLADVDPNAWYPLQDVLNVLKDIADMPGSMMSLVSIGMAAVDNLELPPEVTGLTPDRFLKLYEQLFPTRHRNGSAGTVRAETLGPDRASLILGDDVGYPDDVMYGVVYAYIRRLEPVTSFAVEYAEDPPRREEGGSETQIVVTWTAD